MTCHQLAGPLKRGVRQPAISLVCGLLQLLGVVSALAEEPCSQALVQGQLAGAVIVRVTLQDGGGEPHHLYGHSDYAMLYVRARVQKVVKGDFALAEGASFGFAVHSIALAFGYDYVGEVYEVAFNPRAKDDYDVVGIRLAPEHRLNVSLLVLRSLERGPPHAIDLSYRPDRFFLVRVLSVDRSNPPFVVGKELSIGLSLPPSIPDLSSHICVVLAQREEPADRPFRLVRLIHGGP
jgi:hypothetical protein